MIAILRLIAGARVHVVAALLVSMAGITPDENVVVHTRLSTLHRWEQMMIRVWTLRP
jgi:hypothetical protein